jgi:hypothetical protein
MILASLEQMYPVIPAILETLVFLAILGTLEALEQLYLVILANPVALVILELQILVPPMILEHLGLTLPVYLVTLVLLKVLAPL